MINWALGRVQLPIVTVYMVLGAVNGVSSTRSPWFPLALQYRRTLEPMQALATC